MNPQAILLMMKMSRSIELIIVELIIVELIGGIGAIEPIDSFVAPWVLGRCLPYSIETLAGEKTVWLNAPLSAV
jgi:hypothetical protein